MPSQGQNLARMDSSEVFRSLHNSCAGGFERLETQRTGKLDKFTGVRLWETRSADCSITVARRGEKSPLWFRL